MTTEVEALCEVDHTVLVFGILRMLAVALVHLRIYLPIREAFEEC